MASHGKEANAIIIGAGPSGISMAHSLKKKLGFNNFEVFDKLDGPGGTWRTNTYPGWYVRASILRRNRL
jgi:cation diffusion facilitator CzcD-associated flavoprotein CzcO